MLLYLTAQNLNMCLVCQIGKDFTVIVNNVVYLDYYSCYLEAQNLNMYLVCQIGQDSTVIANNVVYLDYYSCYLAAQNLNMCLVWYSQLSTTSQSLYSSLYPDCRGNGYTQLFQHRYREIKIGQGWEICFFTLLLKIARSIHSRDSLKRATVSN